MSHFPTSSPKHVIQYHVNYQNYSPSDKMNKDWKRNFRKQRKMDLIPGYEVGHNITTGID